MGRKKSSMVNEARLVTRNGRKYVVLPYSLYRDLIKLIDEILELVDEIRELRRVE